MMMMMMDFVITKLTRAHSLKLSRIYSDTHCLQVSSSMIPLITARLVTKSTLARTSTLSLPTLAMAATSGMPFWHVHQDRVTRS